MTTTHTPGTPSVAGGEKARKPHKVSPKAIRSLTIIRDYPITYAAQFAKLMWPDAESWASVGKCGYGSSRGLGMRLGGGGYIGRLRKAGLVRGLGQGERFHLTDAGREALHAANTTEPTP